MAGSDSPTRVGRRRVAPWIVLPLALAFTVVLTSCGGDEASENATTKTEFVAQANRICVKAAKTIGPQTNTVFRKHPPDTDDLISWFRNLVPLYRQVIAELDEIPVPPGDGSQVAAILDAAGGTADKIEQGIADPGVRRALLAEGISPRIFSAFRAYGVTRCARATNPFTVKEGPGGAGGREPGAPTG